MKTTEEVNKGMHPVVDIIIPTFNNGDIFKIMFNSVRKNTCEPHRIIVVNNGSRESINEYLDYPKQNNLVFLQAPKNLGWMEGVNSGVEWSLKNTDSKYILWINDDCQILDFDYGWLTKLLFSFHSEGVGAVGPTSNAIMGNQTINYIGFPQLFETTQLSGMCFLTTKEVIKKVGMLDASLPGGDDIDYSIRVREAGYKLAINRRVFVYHRYAQTGKRIYKEYWDSRDHFEAINKALIHKHGFEKVFKTINHTFDSGPISWDYVAAEEKMAIDEIEPYLDGKVLDLGCGGKKIHPKVIGVDIRPCGEYGTGINAFYPSAGEIIAEATELKQVEDGSVDCILAKHLLEHILDIPKALKEWNRVLKDNGKLVIIVPDYRYCEAISCDPSHVHAFTPESLTSWINAIGGFKVTRSEKTEYNHVFMLAMQKISIKEAVCV